MTLLMLNIAVFVILLVSWKLPQLWQRDMVEQLMERYERAVANVQAAGQV